MSVRAEPHLYVILTAVFTEVIVSPPNEIFIKYNDFERPMTCSNHFVSS
jgi:hypothetical protein